MAEDEAPAVKSFESRGELLRDLIQNFLRSTAVDEYDQGIISRFILVHESVGVDGKVVLGLMKDEDTPIWTAYGMLLQANSMLQDAYNDFDDEGDD